MARLFRGSHRLGGGRGRSKLCIWAAFGKEHYLEMGWGEFVERLGVDVLVSVWLYMRANALLPSFHKCKLLIQRMVIYLKGLSGVLIKNTVSVPTQCHIFRPKDWP